MTAPLVILMAAVAAAQSTAAAHVSWYTLGDSARRRGDLAQAKDAFSHLLAEDPDSGGALEGLSLVCLSQGDDEAALGYASRWDARSPGNPYIVSLKSRALRRLRRDEEALDAEIPVVSKAPCDARLQRRVDDGQSGRRPGLFAWARMYKSIGTEDLNSAHPQRIVYEGRSGQARGRLRLRPRLFATGAVELSQQATRNDTGGFSYYDILEQVYWGGLEGRPRQDVFWNAEYGQSILSDSHGDGIGRMAFSRVRAKGEWRGERLAVLVKAERSPRFLRGAGGSRYFGLLRDDSLDAELSGTTRLLDWRARAGVTDISEGTTLKTWSGMLLKEYGRELAVAAYSHGQQEFFGAGDGGRLNYVLTDTLSARWRRLVEDSYRLSVSYGRSWYYDGNRLHDFSGEATAWLPWLKDLCGDRPLSSSYRYEAQDYRFPADGYRSTDVAAHTLGAYWREGWAHRAWTTLGYEHSFIRDSRGRYEGRALIFEGEAYRSANLSVSGQARLGTSTIRDESYSAGLRARWSF